MAPTGDWAIVVAVSLIYMTRFEPVTGHDLVFRSGANWTAVGFLAGLGSLHLLIAVPAFLAGRWEGYLSLLLALVFLLASGVATRFRFELAILCSCKRLRLRTGVGRLRLERHVPFAAVHGVRLTLGDDRSPTAARIELLCPYEDVECPPTPVPRQQALFLAMLLGVPLIKVSEGRVEQGEDESFRPLENGSGVFGRTSLDADLRSGG